MTFTILGIAYTNQFLTTILINEKKILGFKQFPLVENTKQKNDLFLTAITELLQTTKLTVEKISAIVLSIPNYPSLLQRIFQPKNSQLFNQYYNAIPPSLIYDIYESLNFPKQIPITYHTILPTLLHTTPTEKYDELYSLISTPSNIKESLTLQKHKENKIEKIRSFTLSQNPDFFFREMLKQLGSPKKLFTNKRTTLIPPLIKWNNTKQSIEYPSGKISHKKISNTLNELINNNPNEVLLESLIHDYSTTISNLITHYLPKTQTTLFLSGDIAQYQFIHYQLSNHQQLTLKIDPMSSATSYLLPAIQLYCQNNNLPNIPSVKHIYWSNTPSIISKDQMQKIAQQNDLEVSKIDTVNTTIELLLKNKTILWAQGTPPSLPWLNSTRAIIALPNEKIIDITNTVHSIASHQYIALLKKNIDTNKNPTPYFMGNFEYYPQKPKDSDLLKLNKNLFPFIVSREENSHFVQLMEVLDEMGYHYLLTVPPQDFSNRIIANFEELLIFFKNSEISHFIWENFHLQKKD